MFRCLVLGLVLASATARQGVHRSDDNVLAQSPFEEVGAGARMAESTVDLMDTSVLVATSTTTTDAPQVDMKAKCGVHKLCSPCTHDGDCVWCADGSGSCVAGSDKGPTEEGSCTNYELDYCVNEPCSTYSNCHTCTMDPFCGFCHGSAGDKICVEGEKGGPLTGFCPPSKWDHSHKGPVKCSQSDYFQENLVPGAATGIAGTGDGDALRAIADAENVAGQMAANEGNAKATEAKLLDGEKRSFGLVGHLKHIIQMWKERKAKIANAENLDRGFFEAKMIALKKQRRERLVKLQAIEKEMAGDIKNDQILVARRNEQEGKLIAAGSADDQALKAGENSDMAKFAHMDWGGGLGAHMAKSNHAFGALESYLNRLSHKHKSLLSNLNRKARKALEKEMHASSVRKMAKHEAGWYACAYILQNPMAKCYEFHDKYAGTEKARELTAEEDTRVCNQVKTYIENLKEKPTFAIPDDKTAYQKTALTKDLYLGWCINNVHVDAKFSASDAAL